LYGSGAARLHEEILTVTARWIDPSIRRGPLSPYAREAEAKTMELLEAALRPVSHGKIPAPVAAQLQASISRDIEELLPHLDLRGNEAQRDAETKLLERGRVESESIRKVLEDQKRRVEAELGRSQSMQLALGFDEQEKRQLDSNRRYWQRWLKNVEGDLESEPDRVRNFYNTTSFRLEPIGLAYLWPVTG
jgi:hypothetical protein